MYMNCTMMLTFIIFKFLAANLLEWNIYSILIIEFAQQEMRYLATVVRK